MEQLKEYINERYTTLREQHKAAVESGNEYMEMSKLSALNEIGKMFQMIEQIEMNEKEEI